MRLWHKELIPYLPRQQLLGQWRECCLIAKNLAERGTPNHMLVNRVLDYPKWHFMAYTLKVIKECERRGYMIDRRKFFKWFDQWQDGTVKTGDVPDAWLFAEWHDDRYFYQCVFNLQEKYDCGALTDDEWGLILDYYYKKEVKKFVP